MKAEIFNTYATWIAKIFDIEESSMFEKSKKRELVDARQLLYYLCSERPIRVVYIQSYMSERGYNVGHSAIVHGIKVAKKRLSKDKDYKLIIKKAKDV